MKVVAKKTGTDELNDLSGFDETAACCSFFFIQYYFFSVKSADWRCCCAIYVCIVVVVVVAFLRFRQQSILFVATPSNCYGRTM